MDGYFLSLHIKNQEKYMKISDIPLEILLKNMKEQLKIVNELGTKDSKYKPVCVLCACVYNMLVDCYQDINDKSNN